MYIHVCTVFRDLHTILSNYVHVVRIPVYIWYILCIYQTYTCVCNWYSLNLLLFSGFHCTHHPPAQLSHGIEDNTQEAYDDADFDIPDTQAVLERFMSNVSDGYDEPGRFASAQFGEVPLQWICLSCTMYMFSIWNVYTLHIIVYIYFNDVLCIYQV